MDFYQIIAENFQSTIETIALSVDNIAEPIQSASQVLVTALLDDHKVICCGNGVDACTAQLFANYFISRFEQERPALPALALAADGSSVTAIGQGSGSISDVFSRQLRALGQAGDVLFCVNSSAGADNLVRAIQAAHERNMHVIALSNGEDAGLGTLLAAGDVELRVEAPRQPRVVEVHTMAVHNLCELVEHTLFGSYNQE